MLALLSTSSSQAPERCVCELAELAEASESMTSHQLKLLREAGLVESRRDGKLMLYRAVSRLVDHLLGDGVTYVAHSEA